MSSLTIDILRQLVAMNTMNPPRTIAAEGIFACASDLLGSAGFDLKLVDLGEGCLNIFAVRGDPHVLFNVHLDTVPAGDDWPVDPFELRIANGRAIGLGSCDIKGAAACLLAAASITHGPAALLLTSDEEAGQSRCVRSFLEDMPDGIEAVVVAEPTQCEAVAAHRGLFVAEGMFSGNTGHSSIRAKTESNPIHDAARWINAALAQAEARQSESYDTLTGLALNIGVIEGGTKANVVASSARVVFGMRPLPNHCATGIFDDLCNLAPDAVWTTRFQAPPLIPNESTHQLIEQLGLDLAPAVDFWTESALFAQAGYPSIVFGPGHIAQAHMADEWVSLDQLQVATETYVRLFSS